MYDNPSSAAEPGAARARHRVDRRESRTGTAIAPTGRTLVVDGGPTARMPS